MKACRIVNNPILRSNFVKNKLCLAKKITFRNSFQPIRVLRYFDLCTRSLKRLSIYTVQYLCITGLLVGGK